MKKEEMKWIIAEDVVRIQDLEQQLAEKDKEIEELKQEYDLCKSFYDLKCSEFDKLCYDFNNLRHQVCEEVREKFDKLCEVQDNLDYICTYGFEEILDQIEKGV